MPNFGDFFYALISHWWALMSCAAFTLASYYATVKKKNRSWITRSTTLLAVGFFLLASYLAWHDEYVALNEEHMARLALESERPYVLIEGISAADFEALSLSSPQNGNRPQGAYHGGFVFEQSPKSEGLLYGLRNTSKSVIARNIRQYCKIMIVDQHGTETDVSLPDDVHESLLYPEQPIIEVLPLPSNVAFTGSRGVQGFLKITLLATYKGDVQDKNLYYYKIVLKANRATNPKTMNRTPLGITTEFVDEGIVKNLAELRK